MNDQITAGEITRVLDKLIGPTEAVGDSSEDHKIENNLKMLIDVTNWCLDRVIQSSETKNRTEGSMHDIGERAFVALWEWGEWLVDQIEG